MSKNNKLTTYTKADVNYLNKDKNLFLGGSDLNSARNQQWYDTGISFGGIDTGVNSWLDSNLTSTSNPLSRENGIDVSSMNPSAYTLQQKDLFKSANDTRNASTTNNSNKITAKGMMNKAAQGFGMISGVVGAALGAVGAGAELVLYVDLKKDEYINKAKASTNQLIDTSSNRNLLNSISNMTTMGAVNRSDLMKKGFGFDLAAHPLGAGIGRLIARKRANRALGEVNQAISEANSLNNQRVQMAVDLLNKNAALVAAQNITAYGGPIDTLDVTNPLGYGIAQDWLNILQSKINKDKMSLLSNTNNLGNDTLFKSFAEGGNLKEGDEVELTKEQIEELEKLGYKLEY